MKKKKIKKKADKPKYKKKKEVCKLVIKENIPSVVIEETKEESKEENKEESKSKPALPHRAEYARGKDRKTTIYKCKYCKKPYRNYLSLKDHLKLKHPDLPNYLKVNKLMQLTSTIDGALEAQLEAIFKANSTEQMNLNASELSILDQVYYAYYKKHINLKCKWQVIGAFVTLYKKYN